MTEDEGMSIDYSEKRGFIRMNADSPLQYKIAGSQKYLQARCVNLSATGVLMKTEEQIQPGTVMYIRIKPEKNIVPPLYATVEVVRLGSIDNGVYQIGAAIILSS